MRVDVYRTPATMPPPRPLHVGDRVTLVPDICGRYAGRGCTSTQYDAMIQPGLTGTITAFGDWAWTRLSEGRRASDWAWVRWDGDGQAEDAWERDMLVRVS